jgi:hypothetical protein
MKGRLNKRLTDQLTAVALKVGTAAFVETIREAGFKPSQWGQPNKTSARVLQSQFEPDIKDAIRALNGDNYARHPGTKAGAGVIQYVLLLAWGCGQHLAEHWIEATDKVMFGEAA